MSGLDKIIEEIRAQAKTEADRILDEADEYCKNYMEQVEKESESMMAAYEKKAAADRNLYEEKTKSAAQFKERNAILNAKQQCIESVIEQAKNKILQQDDQSYFKFLEKLLETNVQPEDGILYLNEADLKRMPDKFEEAAADIANNRGGKLRISKEYKDINGGFILVYGEIEENCTIKALLSTNMDKIKDIANKELFG
jgi:V/A-type H+-transporting ATPase subunit E